jgi:hypothetical protein
MSGLKINFEKSELILIGEIIMLLKNMLRYLIAKWDCFLLSTLRSLFLLAD